MSDAGKRVKELREFAHLTREDLEQRTGISRHTWHSLERGNQRLNEDHIAAIRSIWPQYTWWIITGETLTEAGQVSPDLERIRKDSSRAGKAGQ